MPDLVERTAIAPFELRGQDVRAGQIVTLDRNQIKRLAAAGCVHEDDADNAAVPKADLPPLQRADVDREADDAAGKLAAIRQSVLDARDEADRAIAEHEARVVEAANVADAAIAQHSERATKAGTEADAAVQGHEARAVKAAKDADEAEKAAKAKAK